MTLKHLKFNDIALKALIAFIFICPMYYNNSINLGDSTLRISQETAFQWGITVLFAVTLLENIYLALFLLWSCFLYVYFNFPSIGGNYVMNIFMFCLLYQIVYKIVNVDNVHRIFHAITIFCAINLVMLLMQTLGYDPLFMRKGEMNFDKVGLMGLKAFLGSFLAMCIPIVAYYNVRMSAMLLIPIYFTESSCAMLAGMVAYIFMIYQFHLKKARRVFLVILFVFMSLATIFVIKDYKTLMFEDRFSLWKISIKDSLTHPVVGMGMDSFRNLGNFKPFVYFKNVRTNESFKVSRESVLEYINTGKLNVPSGSNVKQGDTLDPWDHPHNEYVSLLYEFSIVGCLIILFFMRNIYIRYKAMSFNRTVTLLFAFFIIVSIISIGQFPFHVARNVYLIGIMLPIFYKLTEKQERDLYAA